MSQALSDKPVPIQSFLESMTIRALGIQLFIHLHLDKIVCSHFVFVFQVLNSHCLLFDCFFSNPFLAASWDLPIFFLLFWFHNHKSREKLNLKTFFFFDSYPDLYYQLVNLILPCLEILFHISCNANISMSQFISCVLLNLLSPWTCDHFLCFRSHYSELPSASLLISMIFICKAYFHY